MVRTILFVFLVFSSNSIAQHKGIHLNDLFGQWHETHGLDKFPCMNKAEEQYFTRLITIAKNEEKKKILADHRRAVQPRSRMPASINPQSLTKANFICPPFRGVRNPHPQVRDFGTASTFERIRLSPTHMQILSGQSKNEKWPVHFNSGRGYFEGKTPRGTPTNIIPMTPPPGEQVRFIVQYLIWQDKTPPSLTLCYREDLHKQCNPYAKPGTVPDASAPAAPSIATPSSPAPVKKVGG